MISNVIFVEQPMEVAGRNLINRLKTFYHKKLNVWFTKKWLPEIKRWAVYFRPNQLMLTNINNGTERLNRELKTEELVDYKKCSLSEMLKVVIESFLPPLYHRYV